LEFIFLEFIFSKISFLKKITFQQTNGAQEKHVRLSKLTVKANAMLKATVTDNKYQQ
jgi:hypothetical protein